MMAGRFAWSTWVISLISTGATWESIGCVVTPKPSVFTLEVSRTIGRPALAYSDKFDTPTDELNGPTTAKACDATAWCSAATPPAAVALSSSFKSESCTPSTPPAALIWSTASCAPSAMSMPVDACSPVIGPSTAINPATGGFFDWAEPASTAGPALCAHDAVIAERQTTTNAIAPEPSRNLPRSMSLPRSHASGNGCAAEHRDLTPRC